MSQVQSCLLMFASINQSVLGTFDWIMISQSEYDWVGYKNYWELPINQMKTATLTALFSIHLTCILQITDSDSCVEIMLTRESTVKDVQDTYVVGSQYYSSGMLLSTTVFFKKKLMQNTPYWYCKPDIAIAIWRSHEKLEGQQNKKDRGPCLIVPVT